MKNAMTVLTALGGLTVMAVEPWTASEEVTIRVKAPAVCAARRLRPVNFIYESGETVSTPAVEQVWFQNEALDSKVVR